MQNFTKGLIRLIGKTKVEDVVNRSGPGWEPGFLNALPGLKEKVSKEQ